VEDTVLMVAIAASTISECQHEAICAGPAGEVLLASLAHPTAPALREAAGTLLQRLRSLAVTTRGHARRWYSLQLGAAMRCAESRGSAAAAALVEELLSQGPALQAKCLSAGLASALRQQLSAGRPMRLEVLLPWIRGPASPLTASAARGLAKSLSPLSTALASALQARGCALRAWARRALRRPAAKAEARSGGWLPRRCPLQRQGPRRAGRSSQRSEAPRVARPSQAPAKRRLAEVAEGPARQWRLRSS